MQTYILSIVGMILLSVVAGLILPEGKMNAYVKSTIALFLFFVILSPIIKLVKGENVFSDINFSVQESFIDGTASAQVAGMKQRVKSSVEKNFLCKCSVEIEYKTTNGVASVLNTEIWITESENALHTNELEDIKKQVATLLKIDEEKVTVYG